MPKSGGGCSMWLLRTKNRVFIVTPEKTPLGFIKELLSDPKSYPNVTLQGVV